MVYKFATPRVTFSHTVFVVAFALCMSALLSNEITATICVRRGDACKDHPATVNRIMCQQFSLRVCVRKCVR